MSIQVAFHQGVLPELTLTGDGLAQAGFTAGAMFRISLYRNGLILTRLDDETDVATLMSELDGSDTEGADWVGDNGELMLAGEWLTQSGLLGSPLEITGLPDKIVIWAAHGVMLA
ncbi:SymE family type I addiction module toxin [Pectobacterium versatile]|uniref:SymE family type I addiction module toxin n=1 Tax=Pectobacterium versatile TaxID=2488639 RepID=UPI001CC98AC9|nr:SymE family type I addiction module toxin [Pectobacterium versatile]